MGERNGTAVSWLLQSGEPAIRLMTRRDVLGQQDPGDPDEVLAGPMLMALLSGQQPDGGFGVHFYRKWTGAHWRLISLTELEIPPLEPRAVAAASTVLARLDPARTRVAVIDGLARRCASIEGNALAVWCRLGLAADPRVHAVAGALIGWQWPDGGWNCDRAASGRRSSFHESIGPAWGLHEYWRATGDQAARDAADRAAELFLEHRLFRAMFHRPGHQPRLACPALPAVLALRHTAGAPDLDADGQSRGSASWRRAGRTGTQAAAGRPLAGWRVLVAVAGKCCDARSRGLGQIRPERDDHPQRLARAAGSGQAGSDVLTNDYSCMTIHVSSIRLFILGTLAASGPLHGHQIRQQAQTDRTETWTDIKVGSVYGALKPIRERGRTHGAPAPDRTCRCRDPLAF